MRKYEITNFLCDQTYGGVYAWSGDIEPLNDQIIERCVMTLEKHYGSGRKYITEEIDKSKQLKKYKFVAWLTDHKETRQLFVIGFSDTVENCVQSIYDLGDKYFEEKSEEFKY